MYYVNAQGEAGIPSTVRISTPTHGCQKLVAQKIPSSFQGRIIDVWESFQNGGFCNICSLRT